MPTLGFSRRPLVLYALIASGEVFVELFDLQVMKVSNFRKSESLAGDPHEEEPESCGHPWKQPWEELSVTP